jgi:hypothetical protein
LATGGNDTIMSKQVIQCGLKTHEVLARLRDRYKAPEYAFFTEISSGTGYNRGQRADCLSIGLWPSRGMHVTGFEVKVSRGDWLAEKRNPKKAEAIAAYCDFWYLVVGDPAIVFDINEIPDNWGLIVPHGRGLSVKKEAVKLVSRPLDKDFVIALSRDVHRASASRAEIESAVKKASEDAYERGKKQGTQSAAYRLPILEKQLTELKYTVQQFEATSGIKLDSWDYKNPEKIGNAVRILLNGELDKHRIQGIKTLAAELLENVLSYERFQFHNHK